MRSQGGGEVGDVRGLIFAAKEDVAFWDFSPPGCSADLLNEKGNAVSCVINGKRMLKDIAITVAAKGHMLVLGIIKGDAEHLARICSAFEKPAKQIVLVAIDGADRLG